jgi:SAM-dependent methyltransferase
LPLEDSSVDLVSAFSVFTHIESFDLAWMMEIRRVLRPGGIAWITFHSQHLWREMKESDRMYKKWRNHPEFAAHRQSVQSDFKRLAFRWRKDRSYTSILFYDAEYLCSRWSRCLQVLEVRRRAHMNQDVIVLQKCF